MTIPATTGAAASLSDQYFDKYYFPYNPTAATSAGIHLYDGRLEDYSKSGVAARAFSSIDAELSTPTTSAAG